MFSKNKMLSHLYTTRLNDIEKVNNPNHGSQGNPLIEVEITDKDKNRSRVNTNNCLAVQSFFMKAGVPFTVAEGQSPFGPCVVEMDQANLTKSFLSKQ